MPQLIPFEQWHSDVLAFMLGTFDTPASEVAEIGNFDYKASYERGDSVEKAATDAVDSIPH